MMEAIIITELHDRYLHELSNAPKTTRELSNRFCVTTDSVLRIIRRLRADGLVKTHKLHGAIRNSNRHELAKPYQELIDTGMIVVGNRATQSTISEKEILYAAILRNGGFTGQRLINQFGKVFPDRKPSTVRGVLRRAMDRNDVR